jgi:c-di-GMP-binding flagellar brake protein YcgR
MLNDSTMGKNETTSTDRREAERTTVDTDVVVTWHFQPGQSVRYRSLDFSETGMRIASSTPLLEGMTGVLVSVLPEGRRLDRAVMVVWSRSDGRTATGGHEAGLRFF